MSGIDEILSSYSVKTPDERSEKDAITLDLVGAYEAAELIGVSRSALSELGKSTTTSHRRWLGFAAGRSGSAGRSTSTPPSLGDSGAGAGAAGARFHPWS
jgi:hypothetical protein